MLGGVKLLGLGAMGAAIATVVSFAVSLVYTRIMSYRLTKLKGNNRILLHAFAAVIMTGIIYILLYSYNLIFWITRWYFLLLFGVIGLIIYLSVLAVFKEFTKEDFWFYIDTLNLKKMIRYIKCNISNEQEIDDAIAHVERLDTLINCLTMM